jgi:cytochrome b561
LFHFPGMNVLGSSAARYSPVAMLLHWLIAIAAIANWRIAEAAEHASEAEAQGIMGNHMALGVIIFALVILRLIWRFTRRQPPVADHLKSWEAALARVTHTLFYIILLTLPILGWVAMSAYGGTISLFGLFDWPSLPLAQNRELAETIFEIHHTIGGILVLLIALHVLAVLKHTLIDRDGNIFRMLPFGQPKV